MAFASRVCSAVEEMIVYMGRKSKLVEQDKMEWPCRVEGSCVFVGG